MKKVKDIEIAVEFKKEEESNVVVANEESYYNAAKELGVEKAQVDSLNDLNKKYAEAVLEAAADKSIEIFKNDKERQEVDFKASMGKNNSLSINVNREKTFRMPGKDEEIVKPSITAHVETFKVSKSRRKNLEDKIKQALAK